MSSIKELKEEAQELIDFGNSREKAEGYGMMKVIDKLSSDFNPKWKSVSWDVLDFKGQAQQRWDIHLDDYPNATCWEDVYDEEMFEDALETMINKHDASIGVSWIAVDFWLDELCLKEI